MKAFTCESLLFFILEKMADKKYENVSHKY